MSTPIMTTPHNRGENYTQTTMQKYLQTLSDYPAKHRRKIRVGIIGTGLIARKHLRLYAQMTDVEVIALCDISKNDLEAAALLFNVPNQYTDYREMLKRDDLDAVDVCLHNNLHAPVSIDVMRAGKHCYCEKPMAGSYYDAKHMLDVSNETGKMLHIQMAAIYYQEARAAKTLIEAGKLGRIFHARAAYYRRRGRPFVDGYGRPDFVRKDVAAGGTLYDTGVYAIMQTLYLLDNPKVSRVSGLAYQERPMDEERRKICGYDVEEFDIGLVRFEDNRSMDIITSWAVHMNEWDASYILGSDGGIRLHPFGYFFNIGDLDMDAAADLDHFDQRVNDLRENADAYDLSQHHWIAALQGRVPLMPTRELALNMQLIGEGIYLSSKLGRELTAEEIIQMSKSTAIKL